MGSSPPLPYRPPVPQDAGGLEPARERVLEALGLHFANDDLSMKELDRRLAVAVRTSDRGELERLLADLPPLQPDGAQGASQDPARYSQYDGPASGQGAAGDAAYVPRRGVMMALLGGSVRKGRWAVPRHLKVYAFLGGVTVDLRNAQLAPGVTEIDVLVGMGGVEVLVPPGVRVEVVGMALMGGFEADTDDAFAPAQGGPVVRLSGLAVMGGVEAKTKRPKAKALRAFQRKLDAARRRGGQD